MNKESNLNLIEFIGLCIATIIVFLILISPLLVMYFVHPILGIVMFILMFFWSVIIVYEDGREKRANRDIAIERARELGLTDEQIFDLTRR